MNDDELFELRSAITRLTEQIEQLMDLIFDVSRQG